MMFTENELSYECERIAAEIAEYFAEQAAYDFSPDESDVCVYLADNGSESYITWSASPCGSSCDLTGSAYVSDVRRLADGDYLFEQLSAALCDLEDAYPEYAA